MPFPISTLLCISFFTILFRPHHSHVCNAVPTVAWLDNYSNVDQERGTPHIPSPLVIAYASWGQCDATLLQAVRNGANVIMWFSINLSSVNGTPQISGALPDAACIARMAGSMEDAPYSVLHMVSVGGWNAPWPSTRHSADAWFAAFDAWNRHVIAHTHAWRGFDGIDWDVEGHDDSSQRANHVTEDHLLLIGEFSMLAKRAGYIVSLAPAQSYLDAESGSFDLSLTHTPVWKPDFPFHGQNLYAFWLALYNTTELPSGNSVPTFDWVGLQLYESWSRSNDALARRDLPFDHYAEHLVSKMDRGWLVDFGRLGGVRLVRVPRYRLVFGLANGWARPYPPVRKVLLVLPHDLRVAWRRVEFGGFMFWTVAEEGSEIDGKEMFMAKELSDIVNVGRF